MYYNTPFPHNVFSIVKIACSIGEKLSRVFISLLVYCSLAIYASEARFIAHSHRASEERLFARVRRARRVIARSRSASETRFIARERAIRRSVERSHSSHRRAKPFIIFVDRSHSSHRICGASRLYPFLRESESVACM